jgi:hypothetical protein
MLLFKLDQAVEHDGGSRFDWEFTARPWIAQSRGQSGQWLWNFRMRQRTVCPAIVRPLQKTKKAAGFRLRPF